MRPGLLRVLRGADWKVSMAQRECCERAKADGTTSESSGWIMSTELNGNPWFREHEMKPWSFSSKLTVPLDCQSLFLCRAQFVRPDNENLWSKSSRGAQLIDPSQITDLGQNQG